MALELDDTTTLAESRRSELKRAIRHCERQLAALAKSGDDKPDRAATVDVGMLMPPGICGEVRRGLVGFGRDVR